MKILDRILEVVLAILVAVMVIGCLWQVFTRFVLNDPSQWTEELLRYLLIWCTMLGVPYAYGKHQHLAINLAINGMSERGKTILHLIIEILVLILSVSVFIIGGIMVTANASGQISPALLLPMEVYYVCLPICGVLMVIYSLRDLFGYIKKLREVK